MCAAAIIKWSSREGNLVFKVCACALLSRPECELHATACPTFGYGGEHVGPKKSEVSAERSTTQCNTSKRELPHQSRQSPRSSSPSFSFPNISFSPPLCLCCRANSPGRFSSLKVKTSNSRSLLKKAINTFNDLVTTALTGGYRANLCGARKWS